MGREFHNRPSDILGLSASDIWKLNFDFAVLHNLKALEQKAQNEDPQAAAAIEKTKKTASQMEQQYGRAADADLVEKMLSM